MAIRLLQIIVPKNNFEQVDNQIKNFDVIEAWSVKNNTQDTIILSVLIRLEKCQLLLDKLQSKIDKDVIDKIIVSTVEAVLPKARINANEKQSKLKITDESERVTREELYNQVDNDTTLNSNYIFLIILSTIVAALGLLQNHITAIIAAMVIAPMLQPNLGMSLAAVLGDVTLLAKSIKTNIAGIAVCLFLSILIGFVWPYQISNVSVLLQNTEIGYSAIALALASGATAALSLTSQLSSALVGVMVAVALLPPLVTTGILLGAGLYFQSVWTGLLFMINIVCINLAANLIFLYQGIHPLKWYEKKHAKTAIFWYLLFWISMLLALFLAIHLYRLH